jgi:hypothetical protein
LAALGVFSAAAAYGHGGLPKGGPAGSLYVAISGPLGLAVGATDVAAGDVISRTVTLENRGQGALGAIALAVDVTHSSALDRDSRSGLRIRVDGCSTPWTGGSALRCAGRLTEVVGWRPLAASRSPWQLGSLPAKSSEWLRVSLQLPPEAATDVASRRTTIAYRFTAQ